MFSGVLTEYNGEVKATEDKADEEVKKEELSRQRLIKKHKRELHKIVVKKYGSLYNLKKL